MKIEELINLKYKDLSENERYICQYFYEHKKEFCNCPIDNIAKNCGVSKTMMVRFAKHLGLSGFKELKAMVQMEEHDTGHSEDDTINRMTGSYHKMIDDFKKHDYTKIFDALYNAERIIVYGSGSSQAHAASEMKRIFLPHKTFINLHGHDMANAIEKNINKNDVVFLFSLSGEAGYMINLAKKLSIKGAFVVSVTRMSNNTLSTCCTENLYIESVSMNIKNYGEYESSTPYFILIELFYIAYRNYLTTKQV